MSNDDSHKQPLARTTAGGLDLSGGAPAEVFEPLDYAAPANTAPGGPAPRLISPRLLLPYRWSIISVFLLVASAAVAGIWVLLVPAYKATALIEVSPVIPQLLAGKSDMVPLYESYRGSQADYLTNPVVLNGVLDDSRIKATAWYRAAPTSPLESLLDRLHLRPPKPPMDRLTEALKAEVPKGKQLIYVSMTAATPNEAKLIVDRVLEEYVKFTNERTSVSDNEVMTRLRKEMGDCEIKLRTLESDAPRLRQQLGTGAPEELVKQRALDLLKLESTVSSLKTEIEIARRTLEYVHKADVGSQTQPSGATATEPATAPASAPTPSTPRNPDPRYLADSRWQQLSDRLAAARREVERRQQRFGDANPKLDEARQDCDDAEAQLRAREIQVDISPGSGSGSGALHESVQQMTVRLELLTQLLEQEREKARSVFTDAEKLAQQNADRVKTEELRQQLDRRFNEMRMNREVAGQVRTYPALEPSEPDNDKRWKFTAAALCGALAVSVGLALLRIKLSPTVDQVAEASRPGRAVLLGRLPLRPRAQSLAVEQCPIGLESVRMIRTALLNLLDGTGGAVLLITSATVGSGKSTLAIMLARSLALGGKKVLLVDTDVYRPTLAKRFAIDPSPGLRDVLTQPALGPAAVRATATPGLSILPVGAVARPEERELLANGAFSSLLAQWRAAYDVVLLDSAPLLGPADAAILSRHADGTILVVRERHCRREAVVDALATLSAVGGRLLGTVFVGSDRATGYGYGYGYGHGYDYHSDLSSEPPGAPPPARDSAAAQRRAAGKVP
jgi:capsular exopolysaccharide synthesis family protein